MFAPMKLDHTIDRLQRTKNGRRMEQRWNTEQKNKQKNEWNEVWNTKKKNEWKEQLMEHQMVLRTEVWKNERTNE